MTLLQLSKDINVPLNILQSIKGRFEKYGQVCISRKEYKKFGVTENKLTYIIRKLVRLGILIKSKVLNKKELKGAKTPGTIYTISNTLQKLCAVYKKIKYTTSEALDLMSKLGFRNYKRIKNGFRFRNQKGKLSSVVMFDTSVVYNHSKQKAYSLFEFARRKFKD